MAYSFEEIMAYHPDNIAVYQEIRRSLPRLVPFIGAGLTQFAYCSWPKALEMLSNKLTNKENARKVVDLISDERYLDAAQLLEEFRRPVNLARDLAGIFSADKLEQKREQLPKEPVSLLPFLFPELVLTTNFDETLETVYRESGRPFRSVFLPGHPELLRQFLRQGGTGGLFKLHGTVTGGLIEYEKIVFTKTQYDRHYGKRKPLTRELKDCFQTRMMLFLGCSLESDRTMELLQDVMKPGDSYYTIINCEPSERDEKVGQLGEKHIRAIVYESDRHEAVRVILEHLLEETDPKSYNALPFHIGSLKSIDFSERFSYKAGIVPLAGRLDELQKLNSFVGDAHIAFRWWAITGPGGSGKSRLAYEFQKQLPPGWWVHYLDPTDYADLFSLTAKLTQKTLLIADYVQENAKEIGGWMEQIQEQNRSLPIRVLLVERESDASETGSGWIKQLYANVRYERRLKNACYEDDFLVLQPLHDEDLLIIIQNYALALKQNDRKIHPVPPDAAKLLLQKLKSVDPDLSRPLYAMFLTDAYVSGQNPEKWDRNDILDYVVEREQKRLKFNIQQTLGKPDERLYSACLYLYGIATVLQDASLGKLQRLCPDTWAIIREKADAFVSPSSMLEQIGLAVKNRVFAMRPDLMGEYFVYTWLLRNPDKAQQFLYAVWQRPVLPAVFFDRMIHDYGYLLNESKKHWGLILPNTIPAGENIAWLYALLLANATALCSIPKECERQVNILERLASDYPMDVKILFEFACGLFNLSCHQAEQDMRDTVLRLENLAMEHPNIPDIAIAHAKSLFNLSGKQDEWNAWDTIARLEKLAAEHPDIPDIATEFAKGLVNLSNTQNEQDAQDTIMRLEKLAAKHPDIPDIATVFAKSLFNLSHRQTEQGAQDTIARLEKLAVEHPDIPGIATEFAKGLFNLSDTQNEQDAQDTIMRLEKLAAKHPDIPDIATVFAESLFNLSHRQAEKNAQDTIARLEKLAAKHSDVLDIVIVLAKGLVNLSSKQDEEDARDTTARLEKLAAEYPDMRDIVIAFAKGLFNLSSMQDEERARDTIARLEKLAAKHPEIPDIVTEFTGSLFNLSIGQAEEDAQDTIARLESLAVEHPDMPDIVILLAKGLYNLSGRQDEKGMRDTIARLEKLAAEHPDIPDIVVRLARSLVDFSNTQDEQNARDTVARLESFVAEYPDEPQFVIALGQGLINLSIKQAEQDAKDTLERVVKLTEEHMDIYEAYLSKDPS